MANTGMRELTTNVGGIIKRIWYALNGTTPTAELMSIDDTGNLKTTGNITVGRLSGTGNRLVVADATGNLSATEQIRVNGIPLINTAGAPNVEIMSNYDISFHWNGDTHLKIAMKGGDGVTRSIVFTLS